MKTAQMFYITAYAARPNEGDRLVAVMGRREDADKVIGEGYQYYITTLDKLLAANAEQKVIIPEELSWIVNSDRRHHEEKHEGNILGKNSLSFLVLKYANPEKTQVKHPTEDYLISVDYAQSQWPTARFEE